MSWRRGVPWMALLVCGPVLAAIADQPGVPQVRVEVTRSEDAWQARYIFDRPVDAWVFPRSAPTAEGARNWRLASWTVETRGVRLQRRGSYDVLSAGRGGVPLEVRIRF